MILFEYVFSIYIEQCPRSRYLRTLEGIKDELLPILEQSSSFGYKENDGDMHSVCELAERVRDAVIEYQVSRISLATLRMHF